MRYNILKYIVFMSYIFSSSYAGADGSGDHHHGQQTEHRSMDSDMLIANQGHHNMSHQGMGDHHMGDHHMGDHMGHHGPTLAGRPGTEAEVNRVIKVEANDSMRFVHEPIKVASGETIKFEITNTGKIKHEFSIGTKDEHKAHSKMMMANPDMFHGPGGASITLEPGKTETLIWHFEEAWEVQAACNMPGHYQAGMHSDVSFVD